MSGRLCILCYNYTYGKHPVCIKHYREFKEEILCAMHNKERWFRYLETVTANETRKLRKERELGIYGEY